MVTSPAPTTRRAAVRLVLQRRHRVVRESERLDVPCLADVRRLRPALLDAVKVTVIGRHLFDTTNGWDGKPAAGDELVVVTHRPLPDDWLAEHPDAPFHVADSVEAGIALAKKLAGDGLVCVTAGDLGGQAFSAGLVDEVAMDVVPVVLGEGVRFFGSHAGT